MQSTLNTVAVLLALALGEQRVLGAALLARQRCEPLGWR